MHSPGPGGSAVAALPLLGPGWPKHADSQGRRQAWDKGYSPGAGGCPLGNHRRGLFHGSGVGYQGSALLSSTFRNHSSAQNMREGRAATSFPERWEGGQVDEEVLCHHPHFKDRKGGTAKVMQSCLSQARQHGVGTHADVCTTSHSPPARLDMPSATQQGAADP